MASLRKKPNSIYWYGCFSLKNGKQVQRSTKTADKKVAQKLVTQWEEAVAKKITEAQARQVLSDIYEDIHGQALASATFADYSTQWLARKKGETADATYTAYEHAVDEFRKSLGDKADDQIHYVTVADITKWRDAAAAKASARTANNKLKVIRTLFQSAWREEFVSENIAAKVQSLKTENSVRRAFNLTELKTILKVANTEWRGMILAGLYTGQRLKDIASLTWANIDLDQNVVRLATSKTGRVQIIPLAQPLLSYLAELPTSDSPTAPLFPNAYKVAFKQKDVSALSQEFHEVLAATGLVSARPPKNEAQGIGRDASRARNELSFHSLRHTATSLLKNAGVSEAVARDIIGHDSAAVSQHYTHVDEASKQAAIALLPDVTAKGGTMKKQGSSVRKKRKRTEAV
ncbi:site-specific integrase [Opitutaceae bacterium TAV4]|nr:site-specific integrase [Opitutaceae bacterium TAV4]RRJ98423.1 site-specific integrase [Opitutaceae bacterium TAV3]